MFKLYSDGAAWIQPQNPRPVNETNRLQVGFIGRRLLCSFLRYRSNTTASTEPTFILCLYPGTSPHSRFWFEEDNWEDASWAKTEVLFTGPFAYLNGNISVTSAELYAVFKGARKSLRAGMTARHKTVPGKSSSALTFPNSRTANSIQISYTANGFETPQKVHSLDDVAELCCVVFGCRRAMEKIPFQSKEALQTHIDTIHGGVRKGRCMHPECQSKKKEFDNLYMHWMRRHNWHYKIDCDVCGAMVSRSSISKHKYHHHGIGAKPDDSDLSANKTPIFQIDYYLQCVLQDNDSCQQVPEVEDNDRDINFNSDMAIVTPRFDIDSPLPPGFKSLTKVLVRDENFRRDCLIWNLCLITRNPGVKLLLPPPGTLCRGNRSSRQDLHNYVSQPCKYGEDLSLETCRLRQEAHHSSEGWETTFQVTRRCHRCHSFMATARMLERLELFDENGGVDDICIVQRCSKRFLEHASVCGQHFLRKQHLVARYETRRFGDSIDVVETFQHLHVPLETLGPQWARLKSTLDIVHPEQDTSKAPRKQDFIFVDLEFNTPDDAVEIYEVTILDIEGRELIDATIDWSTSLTKTSPDEQQLLGPLVRKITKKVFTRRLSPSGHKRIMTIQHLAQAMKLCGITHETTIVEWSNGACDARLLSYAFNRFGFVGIVNPENCLGAIPAWRQSFKPCPTFRLDVLFPLLFPRSSLVGKNHFSKPDVEMLYKLVVLLLGLTEQVETRNFDSFYPAHERPEKQADTYPVQGQSSFETDTFPRQGMSSLSERESVQLQGTQQESASSWETYRPYGSRSHASFQALRPDRGNSKNEKHDDSGPSRSTKTRYRSLEKERANRSRARASHKGRRENAVAELGSFKCGIADCPKTYPYLGSLTQHRNKKHPGWKIDDVKAAVRLHNDNLVAASASQHPNQLQRRENLRAQENGLPPSRLDHEPTPRRLNSISGPSNSRCFFCHMNGITRRARNYCLHCGNRYPLCSTCMTSFHKTQQQIKII